MSDDLVKRLRLNRSTLQMWLGEHLLEQYEKERTEAADRIEKLEAQLAQSQFIRWAARFEEQSDRIEKLEAALDDALQYVSRADWHYLKDETRKVLEGKDD